MSLHAPLFGYTETEAHLSDAARLQYMLDVEAKLAEAEASVGIVPADCVAHIHAAARVERFDLAAIATETATAGNPVIPLVRHLARLVAESDVQAARYVHWGATSQDVIDTALVLALRGAVRVVTGHLARAADRAAGHAAQHANTLMPGRTWLQHATPITFGLKAAGWVDALDRVRIRLGSSLEAALVLQFGGAAGTLAALGNDGPAVAHELAMLLDLEVPVAPWHANRDRLTDLAAALGVVTGTLGKIARDVSLLEQTEVSEVQETATSGGGGSSTMPHKQNSVGAAVVLAASLRAPGLVATMLAAMPQEHERGLGGWQAEWETLPELVRIAAGAARATADMLQGLVVDAGKMRENLELTRGLPLSEAVVMALAEQVGKETAHELVATASRQALHAGRPLADVLCDDTAVTRYLDRDAITRLLRPETYLGSAPRIIERVLARHAGTPEPDHDA